MYGRYISFLKLENKRKDGIIEDLKKTNLELKKMITEQQKKIGEELDSNTLFNLPHPGLEFEQITSLKQAQSYNRCYSFLKDYKEELDKLFASNSQQAKEYEEEIKKIQKNYDNQISNLKKRINDLKSKKDYEELYKISKERIDALEDELEIQKKYYEKEIKILEDEIENNKIEFARFKAKENEHFKVSFVYFFMKILKVLITIK